MYEVWFVATHTLTVFSFTFAPSLMSLSTSDRRPSLAALINSTNRPEYIGDEGCGGVCGGVSICVDGSGGCVASVDGVDKSFCALRMGCRAAKRAKWFQAISGISCMHANVQRPRPMGFAFPFLHCMGSRI
eukprot:364589-Chlamydomonas_euryale.AAC.12